MSISDASSRVATKQGYKTKPAMRAWPGRHGPTRTESSSSPDYEQPFALTSKQLRERRAQAKASGFMESEDSNFVEKESESNCSKLESEKEESKSETRSESEEGDDSDSDWTPKKESLRIRRRSSFKLLRLMH
jgi:hypothetical protein